jgi:hypothetical protein
VKRQPDRAITKYLLGQASAREQTRIEEGYFSDPDTLQHLLTVEDDLIDAYIRGELDRRKRAQFERYFLATPQRQEKVKMAQALLRGLHDVPTKAREGSLNAWNLSRLLRSADGLARLAVAAIFLLLAVAGAWLVVQNNRLRSRLETAQDKLARQEQQSRVLQEQLRDKAGQGEQSAIGPGAVHSGQEAPGPESDKEIKPAQMVPSFILAPGVSRSIEDYKELRIPRGTAAVKLVLQLDTNRNYAAYRADLRRTGGSSVWSRTVPGSRSGRAGSVDLIVPFNHLHSGDCTIVLTGVLPGQSAEFIGDYPFRIVRK